jgi:hypothetical protein
MLGQLCPLGTGAFDLLLNEEQLATAVDQLAVDDDEFDAYGDAAMTPGRMTPSRTPHYTPNRCACVCACACCMRRLAGRQAGGPSVSLLP